MERIDILIEKLVDQQQQKAGTDQMLVTVQLLYKELLSQQQRHAASGSSKVTVVLPNAFNPASLKHTADMAAEPVQKEEPQPARETPAPVAPEPPQPAAPKPVPAESYELKRPVVEEAPAAKEEIPVARPEPKPEPAHEPKPYEIAHPPYDPLAEMPTLVQHHPKKEVHQLVVTPSASLNDKLKQDKTELGQVLKETPIKDLRKAIGINDKFLFVNELFRGDEAAYERSIKTINNFHILPEAEYWINRELKVKLGWNDNKDVVQHFYQLVRRRFS